MEMNYSSLTNSEGVFEALNNFDFNGEDIIVSVTGNSVEESGATSLLEGNWNSLLIQPVGERTVSGSLQGALFVLDGSDRVTIDGLNDGVNSLEFANLYLPTFHALSAIQLKNDASNNSIRNCTVRSAGKTVNMAQGINSGNDNNLVEFCDILPINGFAQVVGVNSSSSNGVYNDNCIVRHCVIKDFIPAGANCGGIFVMNGKSWDISNNNIGYTLENTLTYNWTGIKAYGDSLMGIDIKNNIIGQSELLGSQVPSYECVIVGIYLSPTFSDTLQNYVRYNEVLGFNVMGSAFSFVGIDYVGLNASGVEISHNEIKNIGANVRASVYGIRAEQEIYPIADTPTESINIFQNTISDIELVWFDDFHGIDVAYGKQLVIRENTINNIHGFVPEAYTLSYMTGIMVSQEVLNLSVENNELSFFVCEGNSGINMTGILMDLDLNSLHTYEVSFNSIHDFNSNSPLIALFGIALQNSGLCCAEYVLVVNSNHIYNLQAETLCGLRVNWQDSTGDVEVFQNKIHDFHGSSEYSSTLNGIRIDCPSDEVSVHNNYVAHFYSESMENFYAIGLNLQSGFFDVQFNTIYFDADVLGSDPFESDCIWTRYFPDRYTIENNILINKMRRSEEDISEDDQNRISCIRHYYSNSNDDSVEFLSDNNVFFLNMGADQIDRFVLCYEVSSYYSGDSLVYGFANLEELHEFDPNLNQFSVEEDVVFESLDASEESFLRPNSSIPTASESGAKLGSQVVVDIFSDPRFGHPAYSGLGMAPDIGCIEFDGIREFVEFGGCMDELACNYSPAVTFENGTCFYAENDFVNCSGECLNDLDGDNVCDELEVLGCTDPLACNYSMEATELDASCEYQTIEYLNCDGSCIVDSDLDGVCDEIEVPGCNDANACNFEFSATEDDGSCSYLVPLVLIGDFTVEQGSVLLYSVDYTEGSEYTWYVLGGELASGQGTNSVVVEWPDDGPCQICVKEVNAAGCEGDLVCFNVVLTTSTSDITKSEIVVYPNPTEDILSLQLTASYLGRSIHIIDAQGREIYGFKLTSTSQQLDVAHLSAGEYMIVIEDEPIKIRWVKN